MRQALSRQIQNLEAIADGSARVHRPFGKDADMIEVAPDFVDRNKAIATLATFGIGPAPQAMKLEDEDGKPIVPQVWVFGAKKVDF